MNRKLWSAMWLLLLSGQGALLAADDSLVSWEAERQTPRRVTRGGVISSFERPPDPAPARLRQYDVEEEALPTPPVEVRVEFR